MLSIVDQARTPNWSEDVRQADWIARRLSGNWGTVLGVIPDGFEAYARVLHPVDTVHEWAACTPKISGYSPK